jgi:undecaprenyl diphosphate synthase
MTQSNLHVAIIMDGNGRWATALGLPRAAGHRAGAEALRAIVESAPECDVATLTAYAFSSDNWKRPQEEVDALMHLLAWYLEDETPRLLAAGVRFSAIGRRDRLPAQVASAIERSEAETRWERRLHLRLAIDYSAREEIARAQFGPPVDLLIRTGGEQRLSDFLLWECAYAELVFSRRMWPEFTPRDFERAVRQFRQRERRFGGLPAPPALAVVHERWLR